MVRKWSICGMPTSGWRQVPGRWICVPRRSAGSQCSPPSTAESRLGVSSLVTAHSAREGRVCWLKRFGPSKVVTEAGLSGLGLPPAHSLPSDAWPPPPCSGVLAARRRLHDRARLKLSRTGSRSTTSSDHAHGPRRAGDKPIPIIQRPTRCTPAAAVPRRRLWTSPAGRHRRFRADLGQPACPLARLGRPCPRGPPRGP